MSRRVERHKISGPEVPPATSSGGGSVARNRIGERSDPTDPGDAQSGSLPCQKSSNCTEQGSEGPSGSRRGPRIAAHHRKAAAALTWNVGALADRFGLPFLGFLTLTFGDHVVDPREAQRRMHSLSTHVLNDRYAAWLRVFERQKSVRIHYHLLVVLGFDARTGFDFDAVERGDYRSAGPELRAEWAAWRRIAACYGFGRTELKPIKSTAAAAACYVGKYISKHVDARKEVDKGVRLVAYSKGARMARTRFSWADGSGQAWRLGVEAFVRMQAECHGWPLQLIKRVGLSRVLGPKWAYQWRDVILELGHQCIRERELAEQSRPGGPARGAP